MENNKENIIDYGKWTVPSGWNELTLGMFSKIEKYYSDKEKDFDIREVLHLLCNKSVDEVNALPIEFAERLMKSLQWLTESPKYGEASPYIIINGEKYQVNVQEKLKTGEYISVDTTIKSDPHNYAAILAILCRKEGEVYDSKFENEVLPSRLEMFENAPMLECMKVISFFLNLWIVLNEHTQLYMTVKEALNLTRKRIETLHKNGEVSRLSMKLQMRKLKKLEKSINSI